MSVKILQGNCLDTLPTLAPASVHCVVTSPPYWGLRDYGLPGIQWNATQFVPMAGLPSVFVPSWYGCLGLEPDPLMFVGHIVQVFREMRRVLRSDGTCWVNFGDSYNNTDKWGGGQNIGKHTVASDGSVPSFAVRAKRDPIPGLKPKDLCGIPWRVALALQADGWYLRSDIIWHKPNPMPESCTDRPTKAHEYLFLLTKSERYFYDSEAIRETAGGWNGSAFHDGKNAIVHPNVGKNRKLPTGWDTQPGTHGSFHRNGRSSKNAKSFRGGGAYTGNVSFDNSASKERDTHGNEPNLSGTRNKRSVWTVATQPYSAAHFATFPPELIRPCIMAGTSERGSCAQCGAPWIRVVEKGAPDVEHQRACGGDPAGEYHGKAVKIYEGTGAQNASEVKARILEGMRTRQTADWKPSCNCADPRTVPCIVLDPFGGSGTTASVALEHGRNAVLCEMNPDYVTLINARLTTTQPGLF